MEVFRDGWKTSLLCGTFSSQRCHLVPNLGRQNWLVYVSTVFQVVHFEGQFWATDVQGFYIASIYIYIYLFIDGCYHPLWESCLTSQSHEELDAFLLLVFLGQLNSLLFRHSLCQLMVKCWFVLVVWIPRIPLWKGLLLTRDRYP